MIDLIPDTLDGIRQASQKLHTPGLPVATLTGDIEDILIDQISHAPRSLQKTIGPSEIGTDCDHCLAAKLAGWKQTEQGLPWAPTVGTAIHEKIEAYFANDFLARIQCDTPDLHRFWTEKKTMVGTIGGTEIWGSTDLLDVKAGATVDWKCVARTSLTNYKTKGPSPQYRVQAHLYAKGWNDAGIKVDTVSICFLPRTTSNFYDRHWWNEPYNPQLAADALAKANQLHNNLTALAAVNLEVRDNWITSLPRAAKCWDCARFADWEPAPRTEQGILMDLTKPTRSNQNNEGEHPL